MVCVVCVWCVWCVCVGGGGGGGGNREYTVVSMWRVLLADLAALPWDVFHRHSCSMKTVCHVKYFSEQLKIHEICEIIAHVQKLSAVRYLLNMHVVQFSK